VTKKKRSLHDEIPWQVKLLLLLLLSREKPKNALVSVKSSSRFTRSSSGRSVGSISALEMNIGSDSIGAVHGTVGKINHRTPHKPSAFTFPTNRP
jgi:hypothetical protein